MKTTPAKREKIGTYGTVTLCPKCNSANLANNHTETIRDPDDGNAVIWRKAWMLCRHCGQTFTHTEE